MNDQGKYIFVSYAHKDTKIVLPIIEELKKAGYNVWYDEGIEAGSEWPEYVAEHLIGCTVMLICLSDRFVDSPNCVRELHMAVSERKSFLTVHLEDHIRLTPGLKMQLGISQAMFRSKFGSDRAFYDALIGARIFTECRGQSGTGTAPTPEPKKVTAEAAVEKTRKSEEARIAKLFDIENGVLVKYKGKDASVTIPSNVTSIGRNAFWNCTGLTSVTIPDSVTNIDFCAFRDCSSLTNITIPNSVRCIEFGVFSYCKSLTSITIPDGITEIGVKTFADCSSLTSITIPDSVTSIGKSAFENCESLTSITIPNRVTEIGSRVFAGCSRLTSITIPDSVMSIEIGAFGNCTSLTNITIPDSVTSIGKGAFLNCSSLTSITIPDSVTRIEKFAFNNCTNLTSIKIPYSVRKIENELFYGCDNLKTITLPRRFGGIIRRRKLGIPKGCQIIQT